MCDEFIAMETNLELLDFQTKVSISKSLNKNHTSMPTNVGTKLTSPLHTRMVIKITTYCFP